ncbi:EAL-associated domain-containing protein [Cytobacillus luteolus]|nr:EAL-associated domain-containing protein [Cytobacillus luteolus]MBP1941785.1 EAL domain-containing protein (putative c-di-GMP-specific phosphodiesterase class I) [Cytobacillus luteolus]
MMDPLDIMANIDQVVPYYQAIFSADEQCVIGYEVFGRIKTEQGIKSLGPFFHDETIPEEFRLEVDNEILRKALGVFSEFHKHSLIFINRNANLLMLDHGEAFLEMLLTYQQKGLDLNNVVVEITEHNFQGDIEQLNHLLTYYRTYGIKIAVDNIGKESSNLERIGILTPDILKIDLQVLRQTEISQSFHDVVYSISLLARKLGATLLYEDIESAFQLQYAWKNGGRYYQGYYLQKPAREFVERDLLKERLKQEFQQFIKYEKRKLEALYTISEEFHVQLQSALVKFKKNESYNEFLSYLGKTLHDKSFRMYICDEDGFQQSANLLKKDNKWLVQEHYYMKNWSWRPYFLETIFRMRTKRIGILSDLYSDIETGEIIRTFSYPLDDHLYLFIDVPYDYLYDHDAL